MGKHKQPIIGIVPSFDDGTIIKIGTKAGPVDRVYIRLEYTSILVQVGAVPVVLNPDMPLDVITEMCDGIVISGGYDINPKHYGAEAIPEVGHLEPNNRFEWEKRLITACDNSKVPIFGICYGHQLLNIHYGGTLLQDIDVLLPNNVGHDETEHDVIFSRPFLNLKGKRTIASRHHQAIDRLADGFEICAEASDGIIEAIKGHGHFGMQWHPESDATGAHVYRAFVEHCAPEIK